MGEDTDKWLQITENTVKMSGHLGVTELKTVQKSLREFTKQRLPSVIIDLVHVDYMSSSYIGLIVGVASDMDKTGGKVTVRAQGQVLRLLQLAGIDKVLTIEVPKGWTPPPPP